ncbi:MAG: hypothetical protein ACUVYA_01600 [Planctomycetota bacterium]
MKRSSSRGEARGATASHRDRPRGAGGDRPGPAYPLAAACLCALGLGGCFAILVDPSPEAYYAQNANDPEKLAKLRHYQQRFLCVGFYPGLRAAAMHDWSTGGLVSESFTNTLLNVCTLLMPTIVSWPTECGESYTDFSLTGHTGWLAFLGYFKTYDPGPSGAVP